MLASFTSPSIHWLKLSLFLGASLVIASNKGFFFFRSWISPAILPFHQRLSFENIPAFNLEKLFGGILALTDHLASLDPFRLTHDMIENSLKKIIKLTRTHRERTSVSIVYQCLSNCFETKSMKIHGLTDDMIEKSLNNGSFTWSHWRKIPSQYFTPCIFDWMY